MEKQAVFWLLLLAVLNPASAEDKPSYFLIGGTLELKPPFTGAITNILWKHGSDLLAEWVKTEGKQIYYGSFEGRATLDITTGQLDILDMTEADTGVYSVEINNKVQAQRYNAKAIQKVPQPSVWIRPVACTSDSDSCTLTCDGDTTEAEPVTYSWREGAGEWKQLQKDFEITKTETAHFKTYTCRMENPVSEKVSEPKLNPFFKEDPPQPGPGPGEIVGIIICVIIVGVVVGVFALWKKKPELIRNLIPQRGHSKITDPEEPRQSTNDPLIPSNGTNADASGSPPKAEVTADASGSPPKAKVNADTSGSPPKAKVNADTSGSPPKAEVNADTSGSPPKAEVNADTSGSPPKAKVNADTSGSPPNAEVNADTSGSPPKAKVNADTSGSPPNAEVNADTSV